MPNTLSILNNLIETLKDGQEGFRAAATDVDSADLKSLFTQYSLQRSKFAGELQALAQSLGEDEPTDSGSIAGALHRGWIDLKSALATKDTLAILSECERGEDYAVAAYNDALKETGLPEVVANTLRTQAVEVKSVHDHVRNLRDALKKA